MKLFYMATDLQEFNLCNAWFIENKAKHHLVFVTTCAVSITDFANKIICVALTMLLIVSISSHSWTHLHGLG